MSENRDFEPVHCILDWYDGPMLGVADFLGCAHVFERESLNDGGEAATYLLSPLRAGLMPLVMEDWEIWLRWEEALHRGQATIETHPALPAERARHDEVNRLIGDGLRVTPHSATRAKAEFKVFGGTRELAGQFCQHRVRWHPMPVIRRSPS